MLPHLAGRPLTMVRLPDGIGGERFFEKRCPGHRPEWMPTVPLDADVGHPVVLRVGARRAGLDGQPRRARAPHPAGAAPTIPCARLRWCSTSTRARRPTWSTCAAVALELRELLDQLGLRARGEDVGLEGTAPLGAVASRRGCRQHEVVRASRSGQSARTARPRARHGHDGEGATTEQGVRRLEPERPAQDDGVRVLVARDRRARRVDAARVGRGRADRRRRCRASRASPRPTCSTRVEELGDLYADSLAVDQVLPALG